MYLSTMYSSYTVCVSISINLLGGHKQIYTYNSRYLKVGVKCEISYTDRQWNANNTVLMLGYGFTVIHFKSANLTVRFQNADWFNQVHEYYVSARHGNL